MKWRTSIADTGTESTVIRGYKLIDLIGNVSFSEAVFLVFKGELPNEKEKNMMDALLVSSIDHGIATPSAQATRLIVSGGSDLNVAVAGGLLTFGDYHGGAIEGAAKLFIESVNKGKEAAAVVNSSLQDKKRLPGFGHKFYDTDPRTLRLFEVAKKYGFFGKYVEFALEIEKELEKQKGRKLCMNVDGAMAAVILELGFDWRLAKGFFFLSRSVGLTAHAHEEKLREKPFRRLEDYEYDGVKERELPK